MAPSRSARDAFRSSCCPPGRRPGPPTSIHPSITAALARERRECKMWGFTDGSAQGELPAIVREVKQPKAGEFTGLVGATSRLAPESLQTLEALGLIVDRSERVGAAPSRSASMRAASASISSCSRGRLPTSCSRALRRCSQCWANTRAAMADSHARSDPRRGSNRAKPPTARTKISEVRSATVWGSRHRRAK